MRLRWPLAVAACLASFGCHEASKVHPVRAMALFDKRELDFGEVPVGEWRAEEVHISNVGPVPFRASDASALFDDPSYTVELKSGEVSPQHDGLVRVLFHPLREGEINDTARVVTDADDDGTQDLKLRGVGTPAPVKIEPDLLDFQTLEVDSDRTLSFTVENPVDLPITLTVL